MRGSKLVTSIVVVFALLVLGAGIAHAGWYWNAEIDVEGTILRTAWTVDGADADDYFAKISIWLPKGAEAELVDYAEGRERVKIYEHRRLSCNADSIDGVVTYNVRPDGRDADRQARVEVTLLADGVRIGGGTGRIGQAITVQIDIPADEPDC